MQTDTLTYPTTLVDSLATLNDRQLWSILQQKRDLLCSSTNFEPPVSDDIHPLLKEIEAIEIEICTRSGSPF